MQVLTKVLEKGGDMAILAVQSCRCGRQATRLHARDDTSIPETETKVRLTLAACTEQRLP